MMKKKTKKISIILLVFVLVGSIFLFTYLGLFKLPGHPLATVPIDCSDGSLCKISPAPPYSCPLDVDFCQVKGEISCSSQTGVRNVIFRSEGVYGSGTSFYYAPVVGALRLYTFDGTQIANTYCGGGNVQDGSNSLIEVNGHVYICYISGNGVIARGYTASGGIVDDTPIRDCSTSNHEICVGTNPFTCGSTFQILKTDGTTKNSESLALSSNTPWTKQSSVYRLEKGEKADFLGGTYSDAKIYFNTFRIETTCSSNYCESGGLRLCTLGKPGNFTSCPYGCTNGQCVDPYSVGISIKDNRSFEKQSFGKNVPVKIYVTLTTPQTISGQLTLDLRSGSPEGISYGTPITTSFTSNTQNVFEYTFPTTGTYYIVLMIDYPQLTEPDIYGVNINQQNRFDIVENFGATLRVSQTLGGVQNMNTFYTGYPIKVEYIFKNPDDTPTVTDTAFVTYKSCSTCSETQLINPLETSDNLAGYYIYNFTPTTPGSYTFKGTATKGTFTTPIDTKGPYIIEKDSIVVENHLAFNPVEANKTYTNILSFTTKNKDKQFISTDNIVKVKINGADSGAVPVKGVNGQYSIDYTFTKSNADYIFLISSSSINGDLTKVSDLPTELIKVGKEDTFCKLDSECGFLSVCNVDTGKCETNITLIIVVVVGGVVLLLIIILAVKFFKNKKRNPSFGGGINLNNY
jgi:hypothetical protein